MLHTRFIILNLVGAALIVAAWLRGWVMLVIEADASRMVWLIGAVFLVGVGAAGLRWWRTVDFVANSLVLLGLIGTVVGFVIAFSGVNPEGAAEIESIGPMVSALIAGMGVAMHTTLIGAIGYVWLGLTAHLLGGEDATRR